MGDRLWALDNAGIESETLMLLKGKWTMSIKPSPLMVILKSMCPSQVEDLLRLQQHQQGPKKFQPNLNQSKTRFFGLFWVFYFFCVWLLIKAAICHWQELHCLVCVGWFMAEALRRFRRLQDFILPSRRTLTFLTWTSSPCMSLANLGENRTDHISIYQTIAAPIHTFSLD